MSGVLIKNNADIELAGFVFNRIDEFGVIWTIENIDGWFYMPEATAPDDPRPDVFDGSYDSSGRYLARQLVLTGSFLPLPNSPQWTVQDARERLMEACNLVRKTDVLIVRESPNKQAYVRYVGGMKIETSSLNGHTRFEIPLRAADPRKFSVEEFVGTADVNGSGTVSGRTYNLTYNRVYQTTIGGDTTSVLTVNNTGFYPTDGIITFTGPVTNPGIEIIETGEILQFNMVLQQDQTLTVDTLNHVAKRENGADARQYLTNLSTWFSLPKGQTTLRYTGFQHIGPSSDSGDGFNYISNPSFFDGTYDINITTINTSDNVGASALWDPTTGYLSSQSSKITATSIAPTGSFYLGNEFTGIADGVGSPAMLSAYVKGSLPTGRRLYGYVEFKDTSDAVISTTTPVALNSPNTMSAVAFTRWSLPASVTIPTGADHGYAYIGVKGNGTANRANYVPNPSFEQNLTGWISTSPVGTRSTEASNSGSYSLRMFSSTLLTHTVSTTSTAGSRISYPAGTLSPLFASARLRIGKLTANVTMRVDTYNSTNALVETHTTTTAIGSTAAGQNTTWWTVSTPAVTTTDVSAGGFYSVMTITIVRPTITSTLPAQVYYLDSVIIEPGTAAGTYFDGSSAGAAWAGTPDLSVSTKSQVTIYVDAVQLELNNAPTTYFDGSLDPSTWTGTPYDSPSFRPATPGIPATQMTLSYRSAWL